MPILSLRFEYLGFVFIVLFLLKQNLELEKYCCQVEFEVSECLS